MKIINNIIHNRLLIFFVLCAGFFTACSDDDQSDFEKTRLFRPVLNEELYAEGNSIIVDMGSLKAAKSYSFEVSRDTFATIDYSFKTDTSFVTIDEKLVGEELFWNTLYQVRVIAHASDPQYDSKVSDLGNVRTQRFPTILNIPMAYDVTDVAARVTWTPTGAAVTSMKVFAGDDLKLATPLFDAVSVTSDEQQSGESFVYGLEPETDYQIAIYSGEEIRGWVNYSTKVADIDPSLPNVIDLTENESPSAVADAVAAAPDGAIILVKRGVTYDLPQDDLTKSITIRGAYGFGPQKAKLYTTGNWNIAENSTIDHIKFVDMEIRGEDFSGDYVFNPNTDNIYVRELNFENCEIGTLRGIIRIRGTVEIDNYIINNSVVDSIGGYGIITTDTNPGDPMTAHVNTIVLSNSTFNKIDTGIQSRNNSLSLSIESCTFANFIVPGGRLLRYRGGDGNNNITGGISISNSIFGHSWDQTGTGEYGSIQGIGEGLESTNISLLNNYSTENFAFSESKEIPGFPVGNYKGTQEDLWVSPEQNNFNFKDTGFSGKYTAGDPRWRAKL
ncbi:DUF4957 domain-containing protein [Galbibacter sp.]|uniref:DUF4957 domain-containing protein n=1 Tax=Galbibacter sp. TaxID=2918471 RepID=UPI002BBFC536|nr:DUF5123 domain-containing protein [Galbibacter sp.]HLV63804.1 DUF5123 domain-containing protein [Galbibacter sp.]